MVDVIFVLEIAQTSVSMYEEVGDLKLILWRRGGRSRHRRCMGSFLVKEERQTHVIQAVSFWKE
jgi:hypothetical protein